MMSVYEIPNVLITLNDGNDDEKGGDLCQRAEPANSPFFAKYQKLLHRVGCRSLLQVTMGGLALTLAITSAKVSKRGKFCLFSWKRHWAPRVFTWSNDLQPTLCKSFWYLAKKGEFAGSALWHRSPPFSSSLPSFKVINTFGISYTLIIAHIRLQHNFHPAASIKYPSSR
jgi:hypothetical protein